MAVGSESHNEIIFIQRCIAKILDLLASVPCFLWPLLNKVPNRVFQPLFLLRKRRFLASLLGLHLQKCHKGQRQFRVVFPKSPFFFSSSHPDAEHILKRIGPVQLKRKFLIIAPHRAHQCASSLLGFCRIFFFVLCRLIRRDQLCLHCIKKAKGNIVARKSFMIRLRRNIIVDKCKGAKYLFPVFHSVILPSARLGQKWLGFIFYFRIILLPCDL